MRKHINSLEEGKAALEALGYSLRTRREHGCLVGTISRPKTKEKQREDVFMPSRPSPEARADHPALFAWLAENAIADGPNIIVL
jgi:hypothetical protein